MIGMESLFNLCLEFLAKNISSLESLVGFPEIVGEQLATQVAAVFEKTNSSPDIKVSGRGANMRQSIQSNDVILHCTYGKRSRIA